jgi:hypothetical protein
MYECAGKFVCALCVYMNGSTVCSDVQLFSPISCSDLALSCIHSLLGQGAKVAMTP